MSLILTGVGSQRIRYANDDSIQDASARVQPEFSLTDQLWPQSSLTVNYGINIVPFLNPVPQYWERPNRFAGHGGRRRFSGQCIDVNGNPVANAIVKIFDAATKTLVCTFTAGSDGSYLGSTPYGANQVYAIGYKLGSPDIVGVTVRTL